MPKVKAKEQSNSEKTDGRMLNHGDQSPSTHLWAQLPQSFTQENVLCELIPSESEK